jgi:FkbM family methyltransferase
VANFCRNNVSGFQLNYEPIQSKIFVAIAKNSKVVFDIGAQIGYYAVLAAKLGVEQVFAFDVDKSFLKAAKKNAKSNNVLDKIRFIRNAISNKDGEVVEIENYSGRSKVKTISLDSFCVRNNIWPDFIKMDIEGFELEALEGASQLLSYKPIILLAFHPKFIEARNKSAKRALLILFDNGFEFYAVAPNGLKKINLNPENLVQFLDKETGDFLCLSDNVNLSKEITSLLVS